MPLSKKDAPENKASDAQADEAKEQLLDEGAGAPPGMEAAAEALPEKDAGQVAVKDQLTADSVAEEVEAKVDQVDLAPDAAETPSGGALKAVEGIEDPIEQAEAYKREKAARRWGTVAPEE